MKRIFFFGFRLLDSLNINQPMYEYDREICKEIKKLNDYF